MVPQFSFFSHWYGRIHLTTALVVAVLLSWPLSIGLAAPKVNGQTARWIDVGTVSFAELKPKQWYRIVKGEAAQEVYEELRRDAWSIYLRKSFKHLWSKHTYDIQLDLHRRKGFWTKITRKLKAKKKSRAEKKITGAFSESPALRKKMNAIRIPRPFNPCWNAAPVSPKTLSDMTSRLVRGKKPLFDLIQKLWVNMPFSYEQALYWAQQTAPKRPSKATPGLKYYRLRMEHNRIKPFKSHFCGHQTVVKFELPMKKKDRDKKIYTYIGVVERTTRESGREEVNHPYFSVEEVQDAYNTYFKLKGAQKVTLSKVELLAGAEPARDQRWSILNYYIAYTARSKDPAFYIVAGSKATGRYAGQSAVPGKPFSTVYVAKNMRSAMCTPGKELPAKAPKRPQGCEVGYQFTPHSHMRATYGNQIFMDNRPGHTSEPSHMLMHVWSPSGEHYFSGRGNFDPIKESEAKPTGNTAIGIEAIMRVLATAVPFGAKHMFDLNSDVRKSVKGPLGIALGALAHETVGKGLQKLLVELGRIAQKRLPWLSRPPASFHENFLKWHAVSTEVTAPKIASLRNSRGRSGDADAPGHFYFINSKEKCAMYAQATGRQFFAWYSKGKPHGARCKIFTQKPKRWKKGTRGVTVKHYQITH